MDLAIPQTGQSTLLGQLVLRLIPIACDGRCAKMLILGVIMGCVEPIITIVAFMLVNDPFRVQLPDDIDKKVNL